MTVRCEKCGMEYSRDEVLVSKDGTPVKCSKCGHIFKTYPESENKKIQPSQRKNKVTSVPPPVPPQARRSKVPPPVPPQARRSKVPPPVPSQARRSKVPPPVPPQARRSKVPPPVPANPAKKTVSSVDIQNRIPNLNVPLKSRNIRVFVSSTFKDMDTERTRLIKKTFPRLRAIASQRGVTLNEVDLRWGISEKDAENGEVIRICLNEIRECKPFFIGILGHRYGWVPDAKELEKSERIKEDFPFVKEQVAAKLSVTEMEILYGVLNDESMHERAFFYERAESLTESLKTANKEQYTYFYDDDDPGLSAAQKQNASEKLFNLKNSINALAHEHKNLSGYKSVNKLDEEIERHFVAFLDTEYPTKEKTEHFDAKENKKEKLREQLLSHAEFAQTRMDLFVGKEKYFGRADDCLKKHGKVLITGPAGSGKTALMANWIAHLQKSNPQVPVLYHFCGGAADSDSLDGMLRRFIAELQLHAGMDIKVPTAREELPGAFREATASVPSHKPLVLAIDALDQLDDVKQLNWWPLHVPSHVQFAVSCKSPIDDRQTPSLIMKMLEERGFSESTINIESLDEKERKEVVEGLLKIHRKDLPDTTLIDKIAKNEKSSSPLVLRILFEELRQFGNYNDLPNWINTLVGTANDEDFFEEVLKRLEKDFEGTKELLTYIGASRNGLSETEIMDLMNPGDPEHTRFPKMNWAALHESLRPHLKLQNGCLTWFHDLVRRVVRKRYLSDENEVARARRSMATYFLDDDRKYESHALKEWPWLLRQLGDKEELENAFIDARSQSELIKRSPEETRNNWFYLAGAERGNNWIAEQLMGLSNKMSVPSLTPLANFIKMDLGQYEAALRIEKAIESEVIPAPDFRAIASDICEQTLHLSDGEMLQEIQRLAEQKSSEFKSSSAILGENALGESFTGFKAEDGSIQISGTQHKKSNMYNLANTYSGLGRHEDAMELRKQILELKPTTLIDCTMMDPDVVLLTKNGLANSYQVAGDFDKALALREEILEESIQSYGNEHRHTLIFKAGLATTYMVLDRAEQSLELLEEILPGISSTFGEHHLHTLGVRANIATALHTLERHQESLLLRQTLVNEYVVNFGEDHPRTIGSKFDLALLYLATGLYGNAIELLRKILKSRISLLGDCHPDTILTKCSLEISLSKRKRHQESLSEPELCLDTPVARSIATKSNLATSYFQQNRHQEAFLIRKEVVETATRLLEPDNMLTILAKQNLAASLFVLEQHQEALALAEDVVDTRMRIGMNDSLDTITAKQNLALSYFVVSRNPEAETLLDEVLEARIRLLGHDSLDTVLAKHNLASLYSKLQRHQEAITLGKEVLEARETLLGADSLETISAKHALANSYFESSCHQEALALREEVLDARMRILGSDRLDTLAAKHNLAISYSALNRHQNALALLEEVIEAYSQLLGPNSISTDAAKRNLAIVQSQLDADQAPGFQMSFDSNYTEAPAFLDNLELAIQCDDNDNLDQSLLHIEKYLEEQDLFSNFDGKFKALVLRAEIYFDKEEWEKSLVSYLLSLRQVESEQFDHSLLNNCFSGISDLQGKLLGNGETKLLERLCVEMAGFSKTTAFSRCNANLTEYRDMLELIAYSISYLAVRQSRKMFSFKSKALEQIEISDQYTDKGNLSILGALTIYNQQTVLHNLGRKCDEPLLKRVVDTLKEKHVSVKKDVQALLQDIE